MSNLKREPTEVWIVTEADRSLRVCRSRDEAERHTKFGSATYCRFVPAEPEQAGKAQGWRDASGDPPEPDTLAWIVYRDVVQHQPWLYEHHHNIGWRWCFEEHRIEASEVSHWLPLTPPAPPTKEPTNG